MWPFSPNRQSGYRPAAVLLAVLCSLEPCNAKIPRSISWSSEGFGPDGPWPAVEVSLDGNTLSLYPGGTWQSQLIPTTYCDGQGSCPAEDAGLIDPERLDEAFIALEGKYNFIRGVTMGGEATSSLATLDIRGREAGGLIPNVTVALIEQDTTIIYPDGNSVPVSVGCLSLGAPDVNQSFTTAGGPSVNGTLIPGHLYETEVIDSYSFGLHLGSALPGAKVPGSLLFGGYDENRVLGEVVTLNGEYTETIVLRDISIEYFGNQSPWDFDEEKDGLLTEKNESSSNLDVTLRGCSPYLTLPKSACDAIADNLPVSYDGDLGLYLWDVDDSKYSEIVSSASALSFKFRGSSNTDTVAIRVPFLHLNLTLESPIVDEDRQYFPCFTGSDEYTLGRAFLQDAFIGANWESQTWWLAQAPGPDIAKGRMQSIAADATSISSGNNNWEASWASTWTEGESSPSPSPSPSFSSSPTSSSSSSGLSTEAQAGIGTGVGIAALALTSGLLWFCFRRRWAAKAAQSGPAERTSSHARYMVHDAGAASSYTPKPGYDRPMSEAPADYIAPAELPGSFGPVASTRY